MSDTVSTLNRKIEEARAKLKALIEERKLLLKATKKTLAEYNAERQKASRQRSGLALVLRQRGMTFRQIGKELGISQTRALDLVRKEERLLRKACGDWHDLDEQWPGREGM